MRFNSSKGDPLSVWINEASQEEIMEVLYKYGDEKHGKLIAKKIIEFRKIEFIKTTLQLSQIIQDIYPEKIILLQSIVLLIILINILVIILSTVFYMI
jgi:16S rRNA (cytosine1402-N4)-methyltransferase